MIKFISGLQEKNLKKLISGVIDIIHMCIIKNNYETLIESYFMMGYIYSQFGQEVYALNIYVNLNQIMSCKMDYE